MELRVFMLIRSFRESNFDLYREAISELIPFFFANNNVNYARWLPIHLRDMMSIEQKHPDVAREFFNGHFVVHKSPRQFSALAIDQAHEQNNAIIKGDGGAIGLTEDPSALRRWMVAGPEVSRLVAAYEAASSTKDATITSSHHEQKLGTQKLFFEKVEGLSKVLQEMGNPFQEETCDLLTLDTKDFADPSSAKAVTSHHEKGKQQYQAFMEGMQNDTECTFYKPIKKNKVAYFRQEHVASSSKDKELKENCQLFSRLFISCQSRQCDLEEFFMYENQPLSASLSDNGKLHACQKSQLVDILAAPALTEDTEPEADVLIIDGSALINGIPPRTSKTFENYAREDILPRVAFYCSKFQRIDVIFDIYRKSSLKSETRGKRGKAIRRRVTGSTKAPTNWGSFL